MKSESTETPASPAVQEDLTGRSRFARNVAFAWGGYLINVVAGLIMPRLISDRLGQSTLGLWDFAWSVVSYFGLLNLGLGGTMHRYVARYRAAGNHAALSQSVSTIGFSLRLSAFAVLIAAVVAALWIVPLFRSRLGADTDTVRFVVLFLGTEIAVSMFFAIYVGVLVGCHRWDIHNFISAASYVVMAVGMITVLLAGGGLAPVAFVHCVAMSGADLARAVAARRICPELKMSSRLASWSTWLEQARFTAKTLIPSVAELLSNQSLNLLVAMFLGPAMLAVYSRPVNLMRQMQALAAKFGNILTPTASSLQANDDHAALRETLRNSAFGISVLVMPAVITLGILGDYVIRLWMGDQYVFVGLMPVLALGLFASVVAEPVWSILCGMNLHGRIALARLGGSLVSVALLATGLALFKWNLIGAAACFILPKAIVDGLLMPVVACRRLGLSIKSYMWDVFVKPLANVAPYGLCLFVVNWLFPLSHGWALAVAVVALLMLAASYWLFLLPESIRRKIRSKLGFRLAGAL